MRDALAVHDASSARRRPTTAATSSPLAATGSRWRSAGPPTRVAAAEDVQDELADHPFLRVRMGIHTGEVDRAGRRLLRTRRSTGRPGSWRPATAARCSCRPRRRPSWAPTGLQDLGPAPAPRPRRAVAGVPTRSGHSSGAADAWRPRRPTCRVQVSSFVGRDAECATWPLRCASTAVVTVTGPGGVGKTRLALQVAAQVLPEFADGVWLCPLAPVRDRRTVLPRCRRRRRDQGAPAAGPGDHVVDGLRNRSALLVLDNCEHVLDGTAAPGGRGDGDVPAAGDPGHQPRAAGRRRRARVAVAAAALARRRRAGGGGVGGGRRPAVRGACRAGRPRFHVRTTTTPRSSRGCAAGSTGSRSPSSWRPPGCRP